MSYIPKLADFYKALEENRVSMHESGNYVGFKYNINTTFNQLWDDVTINARGITFDKTTGEIVARPFKKFFNHTELMTVDGVLTTLGEKLKPEYRPNLIGKFRSMNKLDGSLGITFWDKYSDKKNKWRVKTGGSFTADQSGWAQEWLYQNVDCTEMNPRYTYLFEIIYNGDRHVVKYDFEGMALLGVISNETGEEVSLEELIKIAKQLNVRMSEIVEFDNFNDMMKVVSQYPKELEGVVVTFDNGYKCKLKGIEYCELFKVMNNLTEREMFMRYNPVTDTFYANVDPTKGYRNIDDEVLEIPEELPDIRQYADNLREQMHNLFNQTLEFAKTFLEKKLDGKERYDYVTSALKGNHSDLIGPVLGAMKYIERNDDSFASVKTNLKKLLR